MTDYYLGVPAQRIDWELRGNVARFQSPFGGVTRTLERVGARWAATFHWEAVLDRDAARLLSFLATQRGGANRFVAYDPGYTMRGGYSAPELLSNPEFANGTTGWGVNATAAALTAADRVLRVTQTDATTNPQARQTTTAVQYAPYVGRVVAIHGRGATSTDYLAHLNEAVSAQDSAAGAGYLVTSMVAASTGLDFAGYKGIAALGFAGDYFEIPFTSTARCGLVDNGSNLLLRSAEFDNASWVKTAVTVGTNDGIAPDGTATADSVTETTANSTHEVSQVATVAAAAAEITFTVAIAPNLRTQVQLAMTEGTGSSTASAFFVLDTVSVGTVSAGANWSNARAFISLIGSWRRITIVARKTNAATSINFRILAVTGSEVNSYVGSTAAVAYHLWRGTAALSGVPVRLISTSGTATTGTAQIGSAVHVKGLPVSTNGLLLAGDWVEFVTPTYSELKRVVKPLNSDAAGLGYLEFEPILRQSPADNAAVIVTKPMGRFLLDESTIRWTRVPGGIHSLSFTAVEDVAA